MQVEPEAHSREDITKRDRRGDRRQGNRQREPGEPGRPNTGVAGEERVMIPVRVIC